MTGPGRDGAFLGELVVEGAGAWVWVGSGWESAGREQTRRPDLPPVEAQADAGEPDDA